MSLTKLIPEGLVVGFLVVVFDVVLGFVVVILVVLDIIFALVKVGAISSKIFISLIPGGIVG